LDHNPDHESPFPFTISSAAGQAVRAGRFWFGLILSGGALYLALRTVDIGQVTRALGDIHPAWAGLAIISVVATVGAKAARWRGLYPEEGERPSLAALTPALLIGMMVNLLIPARLGELARIYALERLEGHSKALSLSTIAIEKWADLILLFVTFSGLLLTIAWPSWLVAWGRGLATLAVGLTLALIGALVFLERAQPLIQRGLDRLPSRWGTPLSRGWEAAHAGLAALHSAPQMGALLGWTILVWLLSAGTNLLLLRALNLPPSPLIAIALLVILQAGSALPSSPAKIGIFHYLAMVGLGLFGIPREHALAFAVWLHLIVVVQLIILGVISLMWVSLQSHRTPVSRLEA